MGGLMMGRVSWEKSDDSSNIGLILEKLRRDNGLQSLVDSSFYMGKTKQEEGMHTFDVYTGGWFINKPGIRKFLDDAIKNLPGIKLTTRIEDLPP